MINPLGFSQNSLLSFVMISYLFFQYREILKVRLYALIIRGVTHIITDYMVLPVLDLSIALGNLEFTPMSKISWNGYNKSQMVI